VSRPARIRVLIAEDDPAVRDSLGSLIQAEQGLELAAATENAAQAIEAAEKEKPDVALIDVRMPGGGREATRGIKRQSPKTRVLALSAYDDRATVLDMLEAGAVGYLVKGSSIQTILESIRKAAAGQGSLSVEVTGDVIEELVGQLNVLRRAEDRSELARKRIRRALKDESVLSVVFQPIYDLGGKCPVGLEALSRFRGPPKRGPDRWFAEASEVGLRRDLEFAAVRAALAELPGIPVELYLSVNASPATLASAGFRKLIGRVDGARVVVEVTEHAPIEDYDKLSRALSPLRALGVRLAIDDAGAGFASLRHILRLAPDFIKLDRTLIAGIERDRSKQALAAGLISFAEKIEAVIVAEGIERSAEVDALMSLGVAYGQGYFLARPAPLSLLGLTHSDAATSGAAA
jgi:EAL domain-containing protein (putative c-di-GMP-specific phosphodiesterase class I)/DNA-binding NarL/FixJ family response regulator